MQKDVSPLASEQQQLAGDRATGGFTFDLLQRGDNIKPGWWHWRCRRADDAGEADYGYVQADSLGRIIAPETFEKDRQ